MTVTGSTLPNTAFNQQSEGRRRDFLYVATASVAGVGAALATWPFVASMRPSSDVLAEASVDLDIGPIEPGQRVTFSWRGNPVFVDRRTPAQIQKAKADDQADLIDPEPDADRVQREEWLVVIGVCTHLGCVPLGQSDGDPLGQWGGWFCPCHGSHYDTSGRIRKGPAPKNLEVPPYTFLDDGKIRVG